MDEAKKILKGFLILIGIIVVIVVGIPLIDKATKNPLIECQKYVEDWKISETLILQGQINQLKSEYKGKLNDLYCDKGISQYPTSEEIGLYCRKYSEQFDRQYSYSINQININYNNKLKACSAQK